MDATYTTPFNAKNPRDILTNADNERLALAVLYNYYTSDRGATAKNINLNYIRSQDNNSALIIVTCTWGIVLRNILEYIVKHYTINDMDPDMKDPKLDDHLKVLKQKNQFDSEAIKLFYNIKQQTNKIAHIEKQEDIRFSPDLLEDYVGYSISLKKHIDSFCNDIHYSLYSHFYFKKLKSIFDRFYEKAFCAGNLDGNKAFSSPYEYIDLFMDAKEAIDEKRDPNADNTCLLMLSLSALSRRNLETGVTYKIMRQNRSYFDNIENARESIKEKIDKIAPEQSDENKYYKKVNRGINDFVHISYQKILEKDYLMSQNSKQIFSSMYNNILIIADTLINVLDYTFSNKDVTYGHYIYQLEELKPPFQNYSKYTARQTNTTYNTYSDRDKQYTKNKTNYSNPTNQAQINFGNSVNVPPQSNQVEKQKGHSIKEIIIQILLWIFLFPIMLCVKIGTSKINAGVKLVLISLFLIFAMIFALNVDYYWKSFPGWNGGNTNSSSNTNSGTDGSGANSGSNSIITVLNGTCQLQSNNIGYTISVLPNKRNALEGEIEIPSEYNGLPINKIADNGFLNCNKITSVIVPESVTSIGVGAFKGCNNLQSITLPFIGKSEDAQNHEAVLGYVFGYEAIKTESSGIRYTGFLNDKPIDIIGKTWQYTWYKYDSVHADYRTDYYYYIPESLNTVIVTNQNKVSTAAFNGCFNLTEIKYTSNKKEDFDIGEAAFQNCSKLKFSGDDFGKLEISDNVLNIGDCAFAGCVNITEIIVSQSVRSIGKAAFMNCNNIQSAELPFIGKSEAASQHEAVLGYIFGYEAIKTESSGTKYTGFLNDKPIDIVGETWQYTFYKYDSVHADYRTDYYYYIPGSLSSVTVTKQKTIPVAAFNGCANLTDIRFTSNIDQISIGEAAFQDCTNLNFEGENFGKLELNNNIIQIGDSAFAGCKNLTEVIVSDSVRSIGYAVFKGCDNLIQITIPFLGKSEAASQHEAVLGYIFGYEAIKTESSGTRYTGFLNDKPIDIVGKTWQYTWYKYDSVHADYRTDYYYYIPESLLSVTITKQKAIPIAAFNGCKNLTTITIPAGSTIGECAFQDCSAEIIEK